MRFTDYLHTAYLDNATGLDTMDPLSFKNATTSPSPLFAAHDPLPNPDNVIQGKHFRFTILAEGCIRYEYTPTGDGVFEDRVSTFAVNRRTDKVEATVLRDEKTDEVEIKTKRMHLIYDGGEFTASSLRCDCHARSEFDSALDLRLLV